MSILIRLSKPYAVGNYEKPRCFSELLRVGLARLWVGQRRSDINELDKNCSCLLECRSHYNFRVREEGANPSRSRRCEWGRNPPTPLSDSLGWEGTGSRKNHEPEDLPGELTIVPSRAGEQARMKKRVQSSGSLVGLGDFLFLARRKRFSAAFSYRLSPVTYGKKYVTAFRSLRPCHGTARLGAPGQGGCERQTISNVLDAFVGLLCSVFCFYP